MPQPIYTHDNCRFAAPLRWGLSIFYRQPVDDDAWVPALERSLEPDGIRLLGHRFESPASSQFVLSTNPRVAPQVIVQRTKGRLQYLLRDRWPKVLSGNYALRSFGNVTRQIAEAYVAGQIEHHPMADPRMMERLSRCQILNDIDLREPQRTGKAFFWHNLHIVLVHRERWFEIREDRLAAIREMIQRSSMSKGYLLSRAGILPDHIHLTLGCPIDAAPADVALSFLNNLAFVHEMKAVYQFGAFIGTIGEYDSRAVRSDPRP